MCTVIYLRVSTTQQVENGLSLDNQLARLQSYATVHGLTNIKIISDEGISGRKSQNRPGFTTMMEMVKNKQVSNILVYSLSRFSRNIKDCIESIELMNKYNVSFHSLTESIDTSTAVGRFFVTTLSALAQLESEQLGERIKSVLDHKKSKSERTGSVPHGKSLSTDGKTLIDNKYELETIELAKKLYSEKLTFGKIAKKLVEAGRKNKKGTTDWYPNQIKRMVVGK